MVGPSSSTFLICWSSGKSNPMLPTCLFLLISRTSHLSSPNDILMSCEKILTTSTSESSWSLLASYNFKSSMNNRRLTSSMSFASPYPALIFRSTSVSGSMIKTNSNGDKKSPWKIPLLMSTCPRSVPPDVNTVFQFIMLLLIMVIMFLALPTFSRHFSIHECATMSYGFL